MCSVKLFQLTISNSDIRLTHFAYIILFNDSEIQNNINFQLNSKTLNKLK